jgi:chemotaxis protein CheD
VTNEKQKLPVVFLKPGELHIGSKPELVVTVLGSCLSITMFNRRHGLSGICHCLLPHCGKRKKCDSTCSAGCEEGFKYVDDSIRQMAEVFVRHKIPKREIEVKCFGGADMFTRKSSQSGRVSIGRQNIAMAETTLFQEGLELTAKDVGGIQGRKILFYTDTGAVLLKRLSAMNDPDTLWEEIMKNE